MNGIDWINPLKWFRAFSQFIWSWVISLPMSLVGGATPGFIAVAIVVMAVVLTYASDSQWRRGMVEDQIRNAVQVGTNAEAALLARRLAIASPDDLDLRYQAIALDFNEDSKEKAIDALSKMAKQAKYGRAALFLLEKEYSPIQWDKWNEKKKSEFGNLLQIAVDEQPDNKMVASIYADYLLLTGAQEKALGEINKLVSVQPARALQGAMILRQSGRESQATNMARNGLEMLAKQGAEEPENVNLALVRAQFSIFLKQYENAINILNKTAKLSDDKRLLSGTAEILVLWSRDQAAIANPTERFARQLTLLSKAVEIAPNHPLVVNDLMTVSLQCTDEKDPKVAELREILVQGVAPELSHFIRGTAAMMRDDLDEAALHLELAAKGLPTVPAVLNNLAVALATKTEPELDRSLRLVDAAIKQVPDQPYFYETRGQILLKKEMYLDAVQSFERALPAKSLREQIHDGLAKAYKALNSKDLAEQHLKLANDIREGKVKEEINSNVEVDFSKKEEKRLELPLQAETEPNAVDKK